MQLKEGVSLEGVAQVVIDTMPKVDAVYKRFGSELVVTSTRDGRHKTGSRHYMGLAYDARSRNVRPEFIPQLLAALEKTLGEDWDVVDETKTAKPHVHLEWDPKCKRCKA
jgi:hypothetical protein